ncbi:hypothetical protein MACH26_13810 [Planctobacterium marinum]|uniref:Protein kinase domain-containing protein n=1 Tax=Planctobacterium marinum TaxID=1631968 RepID=A0AA48HWH8_9ALTE|nr:hypothetical protein MACH26_13810 [Planctobacterium marinum]
MIDLDNLINTDETPLLTFFKAYLQGVLFNRAGKRSRAIDCFVVAEKVAEEQRQGVWIIEVLLERSSVFAWMGQLSSSLDDLLLAVALATEEKYPQALQIAWLKLGQLNREKNDYNKAIKFLVLASELKECHLSPEEQVKLNLDIANNYCDLGDYQTAKTIKEQTVVDESNTYNQFLLALLNIRIAAGAGEFESLKTLVARATSASDGSEWQKIIINAIYGSALTIAEPSIAIELLCSTESYFEKNQLKSHLWRCLISLVEAYINAGEHQFAVAKFARAKQLTGSLQNWRLMEKMDELAVKYHLHSGPDCKDNVSIVSSFEEADNGYVILNELGRGGFATVYRAFDVVKQCEVALKYFVLDKPTDIHIGAATESSLRQELAMVSLLEHPNIAPPLAFGKMKETDFYIVSRLVEGECIRLVDTSEFNIADKVALLIPVYSALAHVHSKGVVHGDVKPENIMVDKTGRTYLIDFGSATLIGQNSRRIESAGTLRYLPPEVLSGATGNYSQDVFAMALTFCEVLLNEYPAKLMQVRSPLLYRFYLFLLSTRLKKLSIQPGLCRLLVQSLQLDPQLRPQSAEFLQFV